MTDWTNKEVVLELVREKGMNLDFASPELKADRDVVLAAVQQNGEALKFASSELQADRDIVLVAVRGNGYALHFASEDLKNDKDVVLVAVQQYGGALNSCSEELRADLDVVRAAVRNESWVLKFAAPEIQANWAAIEKAHETPAEEMQILIEKLDGQTLTLDVTSTDTIDNVKGQIRAIEHIPTKEQVLIFGDKTLDGHLRLVDCGVAAGSTIRLAS